MRTWTLFTPLIFSLLGQIMHKLYIMRTSGFIKIGVTSSIEKRIKSVQTGTPTPIYSVGYFTLPNRQMAFVLEKAIHERLSTRRTYGEWFKNVRTGAKELRTILSEFGIDYDTIKEVTICNNQTIYDELSQLKLGINRAVKEKDTRRLVLIGVKITQLHTVKRVKKLEKHFKQAVKQLGELS